LTTVTNSSPVGRYLKVCRVKQSIDFRKFKAINTNKPVLALMFGAKATLPNPLDRSCKFFAEVFGCILKVQGYGMEATTMPSVGCFHNNKAMARFLGFLTDVVKELSNTKGTFYWSSAGGY
jgi:hypothetical protein